MMGIWGDKLEITVLLGADGVEQHHLSSLSRALGFDADKIHLDQYPYGEVLVINETLSDTRYKTTMRYLERHIEKIGVESLHEEWLRIDYTQRIKGVPNLKVYGGRFFVGRCAIQVYLARPERVQST